jgi:TRAP-type C4-dicarboxylate transport system substrate-binding protein
MYLHAAHIARHRLGLIAAAALLAVVVSGCFGGSHDRAGGVVGPKTAVLTLASHDTGTDVREWADAVQRLSHGSLRIVIKNDWRRNEADPENDTIADIRTGKVSLASIPVRAYDTIGVNSFQGLLAPFLIDSYALEEKVLASHLPAQALSGIKPLGVRGIALLPGPLQHILSVGTPTLAPPDYRSQAIGIHRSELAASTFRALGTTSVDLTPDADLLRLGGIEGDLVTLVAGRLNTITADETLPSNVSFWPSAVSIVMNDKAFAALTHTQRKALEAAGRSALGPSMQRLTHDEHTALAVMCRGAGQRGHLAFLSATPSNLAALRRAVDPVYRRLDEDDATREVIAKVDAIKKHVIRPPAPDCPAGLLHHLRLKRPTGTLRLASDLTATSRSTWKGTVTSKRLGRGRLMLTIRFGLGFNKRFARRATKFEARFPGGTLRGCMDMTLTLAPHRNYRWIGSPGAINTASRTLRHYAGLSLTFAGLTKASDRRHLRARLVSDAPTGLPC